jgi:hypothetical protein
MPGWESMNSCGKAKPQKTGRRAQQDGWMVRDVRDVFEKDGEVFCVLEWESTIVARRRLTSRGLAAKCDRMYAERYGEALQQHQTPLVYGRGCRRHRRRPKRFRE